MAEMCGARILITGIVQGVGFRPFVYGLATRLALTGWVRNTSAGVEIEIDGSRPAVEAFTQALQSEAPPLARIDEFRVEARPANGFNTFEIVHSESITGAFQPISPDVSICPDCLRELFDPRDRRFRYPFINCTNCGPRFTIIKDIPYDRPETTMASFVMCPDCAEEYSDPLDRRFHAQPVACPACGPQVWLENRALGSEAAESDRLNATESGEAAVLETQRLLAEGKIIAVKGLGGFHLACDAANQAAVIELRQRKLRADKPFAVMMPDIETVTRHCILSEAERRLIESPQRPVVILRRKPGSDIAPEVTPRQDTLGVMLPYTPLHYLLFHPGPQTENKSSSRPEIQPPPALVMTSGNLSEEPIAIDNEDARRRLAPLADAFLMHDRPIHIRCDDSVARVLSVKSLNQASKANHNVERPQTFDFILRRSRGYAPFPIRLPWTALPLLATGAELKNTFCMTQERYAFVSHHIGDLENYETLESFERGIEHFERLFRVRPTALAYDLHPDYLASRYALMRAEQEQIPAVGIQHHHAHIASCMAENGLPGDQPVIGVAFDGTGYGEDGAIWGGEFLIVGQDWKYQRAAHLAYFPLPGGDAAIRKPARIALAYLWKLGLDWDPDLPSAKALCVEERGALRSQLEHRINTPLTSSMGRLFDAVAALVDVRQQVNYEAQAAIELEALADPFETGVYRFEIGAGYGTQPVAIDPSPVIQSILADYHTRTPTGIIAARFHNGVAAMVTAVCHELRASRGTNLVVLSGGVWQNLTLVEKVFSILELDGFIVYLHRQVPANDGGIALGQAAVASHLLSS